MELYKKENHLITVIVPVFNTAQYLCECIDSIIKQTYQNLQIILVDDGSTDNSLEICKKFASQDSRVQVFHQVHKGVSNARNLGLNYAKGEFVAFIDSDDTVLSAYLTNMYDVLVQYDVAMVKVQPKISVQRSKNTEINITEDIRLIDVKELSSLNVFAGIHGIMFRKSDIGELRFDPEVQYGEDLEFNAEVLFHSKSQKIIFLFLQKTEYIYRIRKDSATHSMDYRIYQTYIIALKKLTCMYSGMALEQSFKFEESRYWIYLFIKMIHSNMKVSKNDLRDVRKMAIDARRNGYKPDSIKGNIRDILYLYHCKWIADFYLLVISIFKKWQRNIVQLHKGRE